MLYAVEIVIPIHKASVPVLSHRLMLTEGSALRGDSPETLVRRVLEQVEVPVGDPAKRG
jgi:MoxR-like ATPase